MSAVNYQKRQERAPYDRLSRGMLYSWAPEIVQNGNANPSVVIRQALVPGKPPTPGLGGMAAQQNLCIQAEVFRAFLMRAGLYFDDGTNFPTGGSNDNNALQSSFNTNVHSFVPSNKAACAIGENNYLQMKCDLNGGVLRVWGNGALADTRGVSQAGPVVPYLATDSDSVTQQAGNSYATAFRNIVVCKSNALTLVGFVPYGSVTLAVNGGAPVTVNVDGNGDGTYDFGTQVFPCSVRVKHYNGANATGPVRSDFTVRDMCGGDVIGNTRTTLAPYPFTPKSITRMGLWLLPENIPVAGGAAMATGWPDASGLGRALAKSAANAAPTKIDAAVKGLPVARFNGTTQLLFRDDAALRPASFTYAVALSFSGATGGATGLLSLAKDGSEGFNINSNGGANAEAVYQNNGTAGSYIPTTFGAGHGMHVLFIEYNAITGRLRFYLNANPAPVVDVAKPIAWPTAAPAFSLGTFYCNAGAAGPALFGAGDIGEVIMYDKVLRASDRAQLAAYLVSRWV